MIVRVAVGSVRLTEAQYYDTERIIIHEQYYYKDFENDTDIVENDIALVKVKGQFKFSDNVQPIPLSREYTKGGEEALVSGWGRMENHVKPETLMFFKTKTLRNEECFFNNEPVSRSKICTVAPLGKESCQGDSGGPLVVNGKLVGIVSHSTTRQPCGSGEPEAFTRVSEYLGWIELKLLIH